MNGVKQKCWYKELKNHIESVHRLQYKTIILTGAHLYLVVTKTNVLTTKLWIEHVNKITKDNPKFDPLKLGWLTLQKQFRREYDIKINDLKTTK